MTFSAEEAIQHVVVAFQQRRLPEGATIFRSYSSEVDTETMERLARDTAWIDLPHDVLCDNPLALALMTPEAFAWFLPAYLVMSITLYSETDTLTTTIITCLTPPDDDDAAQFAALAQDMRALGIDDVDDSWEGSAEEDAGMLQLFMERTAALTDVEKAAVRDYLEYIDAAHGADFPVFGPKQALDRYWRTAAPPR
ncbi:MAG TPA: DUF6714 family protein [Pyrinomonadaceae bacterium]|nr:DUF6714 family protein [Pyrinomonadaceae bacterium]